MDWPGEAALAGILAHAGVSAFLDSTDAKAIKPAVIAAYQEEKEKGNPHIDDADYVKLALGLISDRWAPIWMTERRSFPDVLETEAPFIVDLEGSLFSHRLMGSRDIVHERGVADWKFSDALHWGDEGNEFGGQSWVHQRYDVQPTVYLFATSIDLGMPIEELQFDYIVCTKEGSRIVTCHRNMVSVKNLADELDMIKTLARALPNGPWPKNPTDWHCGKWCPVFMAGNCEARHGLEPWVLRHKDKAFNPIKDLRGRTKKRK